MWIGLDNCSWEKSFYFNMPNFLKPAPLNFIIKIGLKNKIVILESTVYPGASRDKFIKYLENVVRKKL